MGRVPWKPEVKPLRAEAQREIDTRYKEHLAMSRKEESPNDIMLMDGHFGWDYILRHTDGRTALIQSDWEYPGVASNFGWVPCCGSGHTDGTVDCPDCGAKASDLIQSAREWLDDHIGETIEDPGYFGGE
jgi:hypothetical protein